MIEELYEILETINPNADFKSSNDFVDEGLLDSLEILELIERIMEKYKIIIGPEDIDPENFVSVESIKNMISKVCSKQ